VHRPGVMRFTMVLAIGVLGCGKVNDRLAGDAASPAADAVPPDVDAASPSPDATVDDAMPDTMPSLCGNGMLDVGEDCDSSEGCPVTCHVVLPTGSVALRFSGTVTRVDDGSSVFSGRIILGTAIWGRLVYPINVTDTEPSNALGVYPYDDLENPNAAGIWATVADWQFSPARGSGQIRIGNGLGVDPDGFYATLSNGISTPQVDALQGMSLNLADPSRTALSQDGLPRTSFPGAAAWTTHTVSMYGDNSAGLHWYVDASIDQLTLEVP
jgi:hypothetical protein